MMKRLIVLLALLMLGFLTMHEAPAGRVLNDAFVTHPFRHHIWQEVLTQNVAPEGSVDFGHLWLYPRRFNAYLAQLESASPENDPKAFPTQEDQTAYWINAHNAIALRIILNHYPVRSLADIPDMETNSHYKLGGMGYTLPQIREKALRFNRGLPLMFTMTDYSASAPPLSPRAYESNTLKDLSLQARKRTLSSSNMVRFKKISAGCVAIQLSPFFKGFEAGLFPPDANLAEDQDALSEENPEEKPEINSSQPKNWHDYLRSLAPPNLYAALGNPCSQTVQFLPPSPTLREMQLLRS